MENKYFTIFDKENIPIIDTIKLDNIRIDTVCYRVYDNIDVLPFILEFNNIPSIQDVTKDTIIKLPDMFTMNERYIEIDGDNIAGISKAGSKSSSKNLILAYNKDKTIGVDKLGLVLDKIKYDKETGIVSF
jgi:hypothetical protein|nr:MAG TPA: hypothetical protein [Caudoviricetes sp.]